jgi:hypothetical protein
VKRVALVLLAVVGALAAAVAALHVFGWAAEESLLHDIEDGAR